MFKKFIVYAILVSTVFFNVCLESNASEWPSRSLNQTLNRHIVDPSVINSVASSFVIETPYNTQDMVVGNGLLFYSDGATQSNIYAVSLSTHQIVWSKSFARQITRFLYDSGRLYLGADKFYCLEALSGNEIWSTEPGKYNGTDNYYTRLYQFDQDHLYGFRYYSSSYRLVILDKDSGAMTTYDNALFSENVNDVAIWQNHLFLVTGRSGPYAFGRLQRLDLATMELSTAAQTCRSNEGRLIIDGENNQAVITATNAAICSWRLDDLSAIAVSRMVNLNRFVKYNDKYYSVYGEYLKSMPANNTLADVAKTKVLDPAFETFQSDPLIVNEYLFAGTSKSGIWCKNLETGQTKYATISAEGGIRQIIYASGYLISLISYGTSGNFKGRIVFSDINDLSASPAYQISVTSPYNTAGMNQYLGQLHCHFVPEKGLELWNQVNNGPATPEYTIDEYKKRGYDFVALTEHNQIVSMPVTDGITQIVNAEEDTQGEGGNHILAVGIESRIQEELSDQERINQIVDQGGFAILAHPNSKFYPLSLKNLLMLSKYSGIEAYNSSLDHGFLAAKLIGSAFSLNKFDSLLSRQKNVIAISGDDYTPGDGGVDGGAVVVYAASNSQADIMAALKSGNFYAVQGSKAPWLDISYNDAGNQFAITSSEPSNIKFIGRDGKQLQMNKNVSSSTYQIQGDEVYVRAEVESLETGKKSWTQALFISSRANFSTLDAGFHSLTLSDAQLQINTSSETVITTLPAPSTPWTMPPSGHLATVYSLQTTGTVNDGTTISYSYRDINLPVSEDNLSIYTYDEPSSTWQKVSSTIDKFTKTVTANLTHFSLYTLSAETPMDTEKPTISLLAPSTLDNIIGTTNLKAEAKDNQAVTSVNYILDNSLIGSDLTADDGYSIEFDAGQLINGKHTLLLQAEDFAGNIGEQEIEFNISNGVISPKIEITNISDGQRLYDPSDIAISYQSIFSLENIDISIDDIVVRSIKPASSPALENIVWKDYVAGDHKLKLELRDIKGNIANVERNIIIAEPITAEIVSPKGNYMTADNIFINVASEPADADFDIMINGIEYANKTTVKGYTLGLGIHTMEAKIGDKTLAQETFIINTNYKDTIKLIGQFYASGKIKNWGLAVSLVCKLKLAEAFGNARMAKLEKQFLNSAIDELDKSGEKKIIEIYKHILLSNIVALTTQ